MEFPRNLDEWTFETVVTIVRKYEYEPGSFDYKGILVPPRTDPKKDEFNASIRRTVCSMANADGGFILFGVRDRDQAVNSSDDRIVGIPLKGDLRKIFSEKISPLQRPVYFNASPKAIVLPTDSQRGIFIVHVPQSPLRPHIDVSSGCFYRRGEGGKADKMNFYEIHEQMMYTEERLRKVTLFRLEIAQYRELISSLLQLEDNITNALLRFDTGAFKVMLADICGFIPPSTTLLSELLGIPVYANLINEFLERATYQGLRLHVPGQPNPNVAYKEAIVGNLATLDQKCQKCEKELEKLFGHLGEL